ncbi:hypothetical protein [Humisphaera borealis]|uniref:Uncharacterized protein n=1 Tax=Humisphaera borealis TaxID=2807512 RepID=A0A7M2WRI4_9BACT|nr:hypothetical protein [Humisphaera borealis]QOV87421.1 hypothetical protein IPV69_14085 [Humisphaera borealis]
MTNEAQKLLEQAVKAVGLRGSFDPAEMGHKVGLNRTQAEAAARMLSNAGVLVLGFDLAAHFTPEYRKFRGPVEKKSDKKSAEPSVSSRTPGKTTKASRKDVEKPEKKRKKLAAAR